MRVVGHTRELRQMLAQAMRQVQAGAMTAHEARAIAELGKGILLGVKIDLEVAKAAHEYGPLSLEPVIGESDEPALLTIEAPNFEILRERVCEALAEAGPMKPEVLAQKLSIPKKQLQMVLDHEWFEESPDGYRMAQ